MSDAPVSRGKFLRSLGSSMTGAALGTGVAVAQALAARLAAAVPEVSTASTSMAQPQPVIEGTLAPNPFISRGSSEGKRLALTFDDGPMPGVTDRILDALKQRGLVATFFMIGERVSASPDLARRVAAEGHEIGNHTFTHPKLNSLPDQQAALEIQQTQDTIVEVTQQRPVCFRPPFLAFRKNQAPIAHGKGMRIICGDVDSRDWSQPGEAKIIETILLQATAGSIIICHDNSPQTANCIAQILDKLLEQGFTFVTVSSLIDPV